MKRFVDMEYQRPDFEAEKAARRQYVEQIEQAKSKEELVDVIVKEDERSRMMWTMYDLAYIRNTIDTLFETVILALLFVSIVVFLFLGR